jgi:hypothetical protein
MPGLDRCGTEPAQTGAQCSLALSPRVEASSTLAMLSGAQQRKTTFHPSCGDAVTSGGRPVQGSAELTPRGPGQGLRRVLSFVWALLPVLSLGQLAPIPIIHVAVKLRTWTLWAASALYTAATIVLWSATTTVTSGPVEPAELSDPPI